MVLLHIIHATYGRIQKTDMSKSLTETSMVGNLPRTLRLPSLCFSLCVGLALDSRRTKKPIHHFPPLRDDKDDLIFRATAVSGLVSLFVAPSRACSGLPMGPRKPPPPPILSGTKFQFYSLGFFFARSCIANRPRPQQQQWYLSSHCLICDIPASCARGCS